MVVYLSTTSTGGPQPAPLHRALGAKPIRLGELITPIVLHSNDSTIHVGVKNAEEERVDDLEKIERLMLALQATGRAQAFQWVADELGSGLLESVAAVLRGMASEEAGWASQLIAVDDATTGAEH